MTERTRRPHQVTNSRRRERGKVNTKYVYKTVENEYITLR